jgi:hypothetical protein
MLRKLNRAGVPYVVESSLMPIFDEHGAVIEVVCLEVDITAIANPPN